MFCFCFFKFQAREELNLQDRLSMEGSLVFLEQVKGADAGQFKITDILGFTVSSIHLEVQRKDGLNDIAVIADNGIKHSQAKYFICN